MPAYCLLLDFQRALLFLNSVKLGLLIYIGPFAKYLTVFVNYLTDKLSEEGFAGDKERCERRDWQETPKSK
jgi:hypothetical protein